MTEGTKAPDFTLQTDSGETLKLSSLKGKTVVLYFYPKADTPGCTIEAKEFRDAIGKFAGKDTVILGISPDAPAAQAKFKKKYDLPFTLLCDVEKAVAEAYGVYREKNMYGKKVMGVVRTTFLIAPDGKIAKVFEKVKPEGHAEEVFCALG